MEKKFGKFVRKNIRLFIYSAVLVLFYIFLYKLLIPHLLAFGCFDDCHTIAAGYFLDRGRALYSQIFYNHQPIFPYLSFLIQHLTHPSNVYELILRHRQTIFLASFIFNLIFVLRFRVLALSIIIIFEGIKFFFFGDRFLPEALVVYPIIYLSLLFIKNLAGEKYSPLDYFLIPAYCFIVVFSREPYIPLAIFLLVFHLIRIKNSRIRAGVIALFSLPSLILLSRLNLKEYFYIIYEFNNKYVIRSELEHYKLGGLGFLKLFLYPFVVLIEGKANFLRLFLVSSVLIGSTTAVYNAIKNKSWGIPVFVLIILALATTRYVPAGQEYFESYRLIPWVGLLITFTLLFLSEATKQNKNLILLFIPFVCAYILLILNPSSYVFGKRDPHFDLLTNYGNYLQVGEAVKALSDKSDTFFVDGSEELMYWSTDRQSSYEYSMYTSQMPYEPKYKAARGKMFEKNPPDIYYDFCLIDNKPSYKLEKNYQERYRQLFLYGRPSCVFIQKNMFDKITQIRWEKAKNWGFTKD